MSQSTAPLSKSRSSDKTSTEEPSRAEWLERLDKVHLHRGDLNRLIMDYLVTEGFKEAADKFRLEAGVVPPVPLDTLDERIRIRDCLQDGRVLEAVALLNGLRPELLDNDRCLLFHLRQQHLIELIRESRTEEALAYAQDHLCECGEDDPQVMSELERTLALLAFEEPQSSPFGDLLHPSQRQKVASEVNAALLEEQNPRPQLSVMLRLLLWAQEQLEQVPPGVSRTRFPKVTQLSDPFPQQ
ncbi:glucose-induced degradation protein 8 homolog [Amblyomma americanum]|uniref:Putative lish motif-containing protein n=1 Tax=Amblyomma americanum TaxID=6943 RepID=A0A0C9SDG6_AMBAM